MRPGSALSICVLALATACNGLSGHQGGRGDMGDQGEAGTPGDAGPPGLRGAKGEQGANGAAGAKGAEGEAGVNGPEGGAGARGATGPSGEAGLGLQDLYGDGISGDARLTANTTLSGDTYYDNLTLAEGVTLFPNGYRVFVANVLSLGLGATIDRSGGTASTGTAAILPSGTLGGGGAGQPVDDCTAAGGNVTNSLGGNAGALTAGGAPLGVATAPIAAVGGPEIFDAVSAAVTGRTLDGNVVMGGAGGSSCASEPANGGGGGVVVVAARVIELTGTNATISANGGSATGTGSGLVGGGGGVIVVVSSVPQPAALTLSVAGGASVGPTATPGGVGSTYWLN